MPIRLRRALAAPTLALIVALPAPALTAQVGEPAPKKLLTIDDYARWRTIQDESLSPDGRWLAYTLRFTNVLENDEKPVVHLRDLAADREVVIAHASSPAFSADSRWLVYQIDSLPAPARKDSAATGDSTPAEPVPSAGRRGGGAGKPLRRYELRELATGETRAWKDIESAEFSAASTHLILRRRAPESESGGRSGGRGGAGGGEARATDVVLVELATDRTQLLGSVGDIAFNPKGDLLAYTVDATPSDANGVSVVDLRTGRPYALDNDDREYARLAWSEDGVGLAVLKGKEVDEMRERENVLLAFPDVRRALQDAVTEPALLDPAAAEAFPDGWVVSERAPIAWSDDRRRVFFGAKPQVPAADTARRPSTDSVANVDIWRTQDERIQSVQMVRANADRNFTFDQAFDVASGRFIPLADSTLRDVDISLDGRWAVGRDARRYVSDFEPARADIYRVDTSTGARTLMLEGHVVAGGGVLGISADGRNFLYWQDGRFHAYDLNAGAIRALAGEAGPSFVNTEYDYTGPKPSYGVAGYTPDGRNVVVYDRWDLWLLPLDGRPPRSLTNGFGAENDVELRYVRIEPVDETDPRHERARREIDLSEPVTLSALGEYTKQAGFYRLAGGRLSEVVYDDASYSTPRRAARADRYLFRRQTFTAYPDLRVSGASFADARKVSDANPQHAEYRWGRRVLFDYETSYGERLQGLLTLPDDYQAGEQRPMLVTFYEKNSHNLHRYTAPSFLGSMGSIPIEAVSRGYIAMIPDVHFRTGSSHSDMFEAVEAATRKVIELGYADPARIGVHGHSYGGEGAAFIGTRSQLFAAVGMGAGVTDLYSDFSQSWGWSYDISGGSGENGSEYYLYGQGRWGFSPWERPDVYRFESGITHAPDATAPFLIMHGTADPTVAFSEGMNFYNALRYHGKVAYLLAYPGEGHGLRGLANRRDLTERYFEFFDHYLRGEPAPKWMTDGVPYLAKEAMK